MSYLSRQDRSKLEREAVIEARKATTKTTEQEQPEMINPDSRNHTNMIAIDTTTVTSIINGQASSIKSTPKNIKVDPAKKANVRSHH